MSTSQEVVVVLIGGEEGVPVDLVGRVLGEGEGGGLVPRRLAEVQLLHLRNSRLRRLDRGDGVRRGQRWGRVSGLQAGRRLIGGRRGAVAGGGGGGGCGGG